MPRSCSVLRFALVSVLIVLPMRVAAAPSPVCDKPELRAEGRRSNPGPAFLQGANGAAQRHAQVAADCA